MIDTIPFTDNDCSYCIGSISVRNEDAETGTLLSQEIKISYNDMERDFLHIFKDILGDAAGLINLDKLKHKIIRGVIVDSEAISLICYPNSEGDEFCHIGIPIDYFYETLKIDHFSLGVYHYALGEVDEQEMIEAVDFNFDSEADNIQVNAVYYDDGEEEIDSFVIPINGCPCCDECDAYIDDEGYDDEE